MSDLNDVRIKTLLIGFDQEEGCNVAVVVSHPTSMDFEDDPEPFIAATALQSDTVCAVSVGHFDDVAVDVYHAEDGPLVVHFVDLEETPSD